MCGPLHKKKTERRRAGQYAGRGGEILNDVVQIDEAMVQQHLEEKVRSMVKATLTAVLNAKTDSRCSTGRFEHPGAHTDERVGQYERTPHVRVGEIQDFQVTTERQDTSETSTTVSVSC